MSKFRVYEVTDELGKYVDVDDGLRSRKLELAAYVRDLEDRSEFVDIRREDMMEEFMEEADEEMDDKIEELLDTLVENIKSMHQLGESDDIEDMKNDVLSDLENDDLENVVRGYIDVRDYYCVKDIMEEISKEISDKLDEEEPVEEFDDYESLTDYLDEDNNTIWREEGDDMSERKVCHECGLTIVTGSDQRSEKKKLAHHASTGH